MDRAPPLNESVDAALAHPAFATLPAGAPVIAAMGDPPRIVHANDTAQALFRGEDLSDVEARCLHGDEPGARRLAQLALSLTPGGPPRLERLRFFLDDTPVALTFLCRRSQGPDPIFVAAALDARPSMLVPPPKKTAADAAPVADATPVSRAIELEAPTPETPVREASPAPEPEARQPAPPAAPRTGKVRFIWRTDAEHRFTAINDALCATLGLDASEMIGQSFATLAETDGFDPEGRLRSALASQQTWSGVDAAWPFAASDEVAPVTLGGAPVFDRARAFRGYNGFGVIHLDGVTRRDSAVVAQVAEPLQDSVEEPEQAPEASLEEDSAHEAERASADAAQQPHEVEASTAAEPAPPAEDPEQPSLFAPPPQRETYVATNVVALDAWKNGGATPRVSEASEPPKPEPETGVEAEEPSTQAGAAIPEPAPEPDPAPTTVMGEAEPSQPDEPDRSDDDEDLIELTRSERSAFREIARALGARLDRTPPTGEPEAPAERRTREAPPEREAQPETPAIATPAAPAPPREIQPAAAQAANPAATPDFAAADLLDRIELGLLVCRDGKAIYLNKALASLLGYADAAAFEAENGLARMFRGRAPASDDGEAGERALSVVTRSGDSVSLEARLQAFDWQGAPATLITFRQNAATELTQRIRSLESDAVQREARARELHAILDTATDGVAVLDEDGRILSLNKSAEALFGYEQNEVAGENFTILFARESFAAAQDYLAGLQSNGVRSVLNDGREVTGRARQGGQIPMFMTLGRVGDEPSAKFCAVLRDLSQWKNAERELKEARREAERTSALKSDFLAKISHEVRTPLNAILGFAEVMRDERFGPLGNERYRDYLKDIHASGSHVLSLVNDLLDLSKIEAGKLDLSFESVDANKIVSECVSIMQSQAIRERVILRLSLAPRLPNIVADERSLRQIVLNILSNAVKFNQPGGQVIVSTALTDAGHAVIRMRDTGIGMSDREVETALEPFRQIETARRTTGTGLGLPLTKALVEANRATFTIRSRKGEGTLVEVAFPSTRVLAE